MTEKQKEIIEYIVEFKRENHYSPTIQEIADATGRFYSATLESINTLCKQGYLHRIPKIARSIKVIKDAK